MAVVDCGPVTGIVPYWGVAAQKHCKLFAGVGLVFTLTGVELKCVSWWNQHRRQHPGLTGLFRDSEPVDIDWPV